MSFLSLYTVGIIVIKNNKYMGIPKIQSDELPAGEHLASLQEIERE
jgi:hypothetical protein